MANRKRAPPVKLSDSQFRFSRGELKPTPPDKAAMANEKREHILNAINKTKMGNAETYGRNRLIIMDRFGLKDGTSLTVKELMQKYNLNSERRVRQILKGFLEKLRAGPYTKALREHDRLPPDKPPANTHHVMQLKK